MEWKSNVVVCFLSFFIICLHELKYEFQLAFEKNLNFHSRIEQALLIRILLSVIILVDILCTKKGGFFFKYIYVFLILFCSALESR